MYVWSNERSSQDSGGVGGHEIHLFTQTHQECTYKWKISTEDLSHLKVQERSHAIKQDEGKRKGKRSGVEVMGMEPLGGGS